MNWLIERLKEPSSYAALAVSCIIVAMVTQVEWIAWVGILGAVAGFILKEKEIF